MGSRTPSTTSDPTVDERSRKGKVPKRINKAVRERLKREHLNDLFIELADSLELNQQNSGKASILSEATRFLKDVFAQIESLRKEHVSLLSESKYVTTEKNELKEETSVLETEISKLQSEIETRANQCQPDLHTTPAPDYYQQHPGLASRFPVFQGAGFQQSGATPPPGAAVIVLPMQSDIQAQDVTDRTGLAAQTQPSLLYNSSVVSKPCHNSSVVSKPCPRYASATDSWPSWLLGERLKATE